nr:MAG TPA_asm: hypothetical protein [Caudoviricetes sp.]
MMSLWDALRMNMMISYQELVRTFPSVHDRHKRIVDFFDKKHAKGEFIDVAPPSSATLEKYFKI